MSLQACAEIVKRGDPDRFLAAMAAPPDARRILFPLYAFNVEVARAPWVTAEPMIAEMRLQWWRDSVEGIYAGEPRRHAVIRITEAGATLEDSASRNGTFRRGRRIDGEVAGRAPLEEPLRVAAGAVTVEVRAPGMVPFSRRVVVQGGERVSLVVTLRPPGAASLIVHCPVPAAAVTVDGEGVGETPMTDPIIVAAASTPSRRSSPLILPCSSSIFA